MPRKTALLLFGMALWLGVTPVRAAEAHVDALIFYNPACVHCQRVLNVTLPPLAKQYGSQLEILPIDITGDSGSTVYQAALQAYFPTNSPTDLPMMIIGDTVLVGEDDITSKLPPLIESKLRTGGTSWPSFPGLENYLKAQGLSFAGSQGTRTWLETFLADQPANSLAVLVLILLCGSLIWSVVAVFSSVPEFFKRLPAWVFPVLLIVGMSIAAYLSYTETTHSEVACGVVGKCNAVQSSPYSQILGLIPIGIFGLAGYLAIGLAWLVHRFSGGVTRAAASIAMFGFGVFGVSFSIYLTFLEPFVIGATCMWCLSSATILALLLPQTVVGVREAIDTYGSRFIASPRRA